MKSGVKTYALYIPELKELIKAKQYGELKASLKEINPVDLAEGWKGFEPEQQIIVFKLMDTKKAMAVFEELDVDEQIFLLSTMHEDTANLLLEDLSPGEASRLFRRIPKKVIVKLSRIVKREEAATKLERTLFPYPPTTAGALMHTDIIPMKKTMTAHQAIEAIRTLTKTKAHDEGLLTTLYVTDGVGHLLGGVSLQSLLAAPRHLKLSDLMTPVQLIRIPVTLDQEEAAKVFSRYNLVSAPVVDESNRLTGVLLVDDMLDVTQTEATEDMQKAGGTEALDEPYLTISLTKMIKKRAGWLAALFLGEMLTATAMGHFEDQIARAVVLALFIPLIISSGGNSGSQASTLIIRAMALGEVKLRDWWLVIRRELISGLGLGLILASIGLLRILVWQSLFHTYGEHYMLLALTVSTSLVGVVLWGTLAGSMLPFILRRLGFDPASASAPFVATLVDVSGILIYFTAAMIFLKGTLL